LNLVLVDENPLTAQDILHYDNTMRALVYWFVPFANVCFYVRFYRISSICIPYFVSVTDRREIVGDDDLSSASDSDSVLEMFSIPPLGRPSQQQHQERSSSSLSNTTTNSTQSPANEGISNAARRRVPLGPFVFTSNGRTGIRSQIMPMVS
jgi:hypothetical protein